MLQTILLVLHVLVAIGLITFILLQQGKGATTGAGFGAGASGTVFGARGAASFMSRTTAILAVVFFANCLLLAFLAAQQKKTVSLADQIAAQVPAISAPATTDAAKAAAKDAPAAPAAPAAAPQPADLPQIPPAKP